MRRKNLAACVATILSAMLFIIVGSSFTTFLYKGQMITVENPKVVTAEGITVFNSKGDKQVNSLKLSDMKLGIKPATGEEDAETNIPSTVMDKKGSEGYYSTFKLYAPSGANIYVTNIKIEGKKKDAEKEREHIMVAIKQINGPAKSLDGEKVLLGAASASDERIEYTFYVWLSGKTGENIKGAKISFDISFESIT